MSPQERIARREARSVKRVEERLARKALAARIARRHDELMLKARRERRARQLRKTGKQIGAYLEFIDAFARAVAKMFPQRQDAETRTK